MSGYGVQEFNSSEVQQASGVYSIGVQDLGHLGLIDVQGFEDLRLEGLRVLGSCGLGFRALGFRDSGKFREFVGSTKPKPWTEHHVRAPGSFTEMQGRRACGFFLWWTSKFL